MSMQPHYDIDCYVDAIMERADQALKAARFIRYRSKQRLSDEQVAEIGNIHLNMVSLLASLTDGEAYGAASDGVIYALRGYECDADALLREEKEYLS